MFVHAACSSLVSIGRVKSGKLFVAYTDSRVSVSYLTLQVRAFDLILLMEPLCFHQ